MTHDSIIRNIKWRLGRLFYSKNLQEWQQVLFLNEDFRKGRIIALQEYSTDVPIINVEKKRAICIFDGKIKNGGLADRLRGIISVYEVCKELGLEFKILFNNPFNLDEYLEPNKIDWHIPEQNLNYNTRTTDICYIDTLSDSDYEAKEQKKWFKKEFKRNFKEFHVRSNAFFSYHGNYSVLFQELFKPAPRLQEKIDLYKGILGEEYISTSFRFLDLLDDFNEPFGTKKVLNEKEKEELIQCNIAQIKKLHKQFPDRIILVNSDSTIFLQAASEIEYTYVIPGDITHIEGNGKGNKYDVYEKTFIDFFMIANASRIYLLKTGIMHNSGYPYAASLIYNRPFEKIEF